jgi:hypothetical protein
MNLIEDIILGIAQHLTLTLLIPEGGKLLLEMQMAAESLNTFAKIVTQPTYHQLRAGNLTEGLLRLTRGFSFDLNIHVEEQVYGCQLPPCIRTPYRSILLQMADW